MVDSRNTLESAFFSLSSAVRSGKHKTLEEEDTNLDIDSEMIVEIIQSTSGVALVVGLMALLYRARNRFNRIVHRAIPKSKFPPPPPQNPNQITQYPYNLATQALAPQSQH